MKRKRRTILFFALCASAVLGAMGWLTVELLKLEQREAEAQRDKALVDHIRLAQVKMDRFLEQLLTQERSRPHYEYNSYYFPEEAYFKAWSAACTGDVRMPSPLMTQPEPPFCKLHFQVSQSGKGPPVISAPRLPPQFDMRNQALITGNLTQSDLSVAVQLLETLKALTTPDGLAALAPNLSFDLAGNGAATARDLDPRNFANLLEGPVPMSRPQRQTEAGQSNNQIQSVQLANRSPTNPDAVDVTISVLRPVWLHPGTESAQLLLLRSVRIEGARGAEEMVQGVWLDWPALRTALLHSVQDLVPNAELIPDANPVDNPERLLSIPAILVARDLAPVQTAGVSPTRATLYIAWLGVLAALVAVGVVVRAIIDLGERRGRFVSAVTHELRTPLTTFCLYSEMLADDMVRDENAKREYLSTLKRESQRLAKIVENVLCYARLAEVRASAQTQRIDAGELLDRIVPSLARRASEAGMSLEADLGAARGAALDVDPQTVERILVNLVDNACKYARGAEGSDQRIHLIAHAGSGHVDIRVADHGPGIPRSLRRAVFKPFNRARMSTQSSAPGLGLGLSLARGLARELRGDLRIAPLPAGFQSGAVMSLVLPTAAPEAVLPAAQTAETA